MSVQSSWQAMHGLRSEICRERRRDEILVDGTRRQMGSMQCPNYTPCRQLNSVTVHAIESQAGTIPHYHCKLLLVSYFQVLTNLFQWPGLLY